MVFVRFAHVRRVSPRQTRSTLSLACMQKRSDHRRSVPGYGRKSDAQKALDECRGSASVRSSPCIPQGERPEVLSTVMLHGDVVGALAVTWLFNIWGTGDLMNAMLQGTRRIAAKGPSPLEATLFIPTVIVPALLITHGLICWLLVLAAR
jgi:hypothetical protein